MLLAGVVSGLWADSCCLRDLFPWDAFFPCLVDELVAARFDLSVVAELFCCCGDFFEDVHAFSVLRAFIFIKHETHKASRLDSA